MATQNKNFKVKNGLDVNGTATATAFTISGVGNLQVIPTQTGNAGKYLSTDGTNLTWAASASAEPTLHPFLTGCL